MARNPKPKKKSSDRRPRPTTGGGRPRRGRPKVCMFCSEHANWVDYKDVAVLKRFISDRGRIKARGATGTCAQHQRDVATAIKTARELALLPYRVQTAANEPRGSRGGDRRGNTSRPSTSEAPASEAAGSSSQAPDATDENESTVADEISEASVTPSA